MNKYSFFAIFILISTFSALFLTAHGGDSPMAEAADAGISSILSPAIFDEMLKRRNDTSCRTEKFYTYEAFVMAAKSFEGFGTIGDHKTRKREIAAFFGLTSKETAGGWLTAPDGPFAWGYCHIIGGDISGNFCTSNSWPRPAGRKYYARGPFQLSGNEVYGRAGRAIGVDLINNPNLVETNAVISFKIAIWFWMTAKGYKPSCHDVMIGKWKPTSGDRASKRLPGYGVTINIISGSDCGWGANDGVADRIGFYQRNCDILGVGYGKNLECYFQDPFP